MTSPALLERRDGGIAMLTLNRPEFRNPISELDMIEAILEALDQADRDTTIRVLILTGAGTAFSSGGNLNKLNGDDGIAGPHPVLTRNGYRNGIQRLPLAFERLDVPVIAAVNGPAIGAGCDLACMCDIRIAAESARFAESFVKVGLIAGDGGAWLLPRIVGFSRACEMALTGDPIGATEAREAGLVSRVVPDAELIPAAIELAGRIAANPTHVVRMTKRLLREASHSRLESVLELSAAMQSLAHTTADHHEALAARRERRAPNYTQS
jgi:enoyl-CoA hydratase/carnithine racemase